MAELFVAWNTPLDHRIMPLVVSSYAEELRRLNFKVDQANKDCWVNWAEALGGSVVLVQGSEGIVKIPAKGLPKVAAQRQRYEETLGEPVTACGVGTSVDKAIRARDLARRQGKKTPVFYSPEVDKELEKLSSTEDSRLSKALAENSGAHGGFGGFSQGPSAVAPAAPVQEGSEHSDGEAAAAQANDTSGAPAAPEMTHAAADLIDSLHGLADQHAASQQGEGAKQQLDNDALRQKIAQVLEQVRQQAPIFGQLKQASPDAFATIQALIQSVIGMARALAPAQPMQKSEPWHDEVVEWEDDLVDLSKMAGPIRTMSHEQLAGKRVKVYRNLHNGLFSVHDGQHVIAHVPEIHLQDVKFHVNEGGRKRVVMEKRKNVHAFVVGTVAQSPHAAGGTPVTYNPYMHPIEEKGSFVTAADKTPVLHAPGVSMKILTMPDGKQRALMEAHGLQPVAATPPPVQKSEAEPELMGKETCDYTAKTTKERCKNPRSRKVADRYLCHHHGDLAAKEDKKAEGSLKKAIGDIAPGKDLGGSTFQVKGVYTKSHGYDHILSPEHQAAGYKLTVHHDDSSSGMQAMHAELHHNGVSVGNVTADVSPANKHLSIGDADLGEAHRGKGLGSALYEGLMAHGKNVLGLRSVIGGDHSTNAAAVHARISQKHGMEYKAQPNPAGPLPNAKGGAYDAANGPYSYALKGEMEMNKDEKPTSRHHLVLPPGSKHEGGPGAARNNVGKVKIQHGDGSTSWIQARAGQVTAEADRHARPLLGQASHPLSSRNPTGH